MNGFVIFFSFSTAAEAAVRLQLPFLPPRSMHSGELAKNYVKMMNEFEKFQTAFTAHCAEPPHRCSTICLWRPRLRGTLQIPIRLFMKVAKVIPL